MTSARAAHGRGSGIGPIGLSDLADLVRVDQEALAMLAEMPYPTLRDAVLAHPTMAEGLSPLVARATSCGLMSRRRLISALMSWFMIIDQRSSRPPSDESPTTDRRGSHPDPSLRRPDLWFMRPFFRESLVMRNPENSKAI